MAVVADSKTPQEVADALGRGARAPETDPAVGIAVQLPPAAEPAHRLVTIGDSLTHGFQSGAIFNTALSYPTIIARELGCFDTFRYPTYEGFGGLPLNVEYLLRELEQSYGDRISWWELAAAAFQVRQIMARVEDWWERGRGSMTPVVTGVNHNLGIYGWDLRDVLDRTAAKCIADIKAPSDAVFKQIVENANERAALRVLPTDPALGQDLTPLDAAKLLGEQGGIETLIVMIGANNALQVVTKLKVVWSEGDITDPKIKAGFTVWRPSDFASELALVAERVKAIGARHVIWATVPHVTIAPIARGVARKVRADSRYFPYYTRPWISDDEFDERQDPNITEREARDVDTAIDLYNDAIVETVRKARTENRDWYVIELAGLLDRLAQRRFLDSPEARPDWWTPYELPPQLAALDPPPNSRFFKVAKGRRVDGGLFSLDGVHPTTIAYGVMARELIRVMELAGVQFRFNNGDPRSPPVEPDWRYLIARDTLIGDPPGSLTSDLELIGWFDEQADFLSRMLRVG
jgi:hypothetical protein